MATPSILVSGTTYQFTCWKGSVLQAFAESAQSIQRANVDGRTVRKSGLRASPSTIRTWTDVAGIDDADALADSYKGLQQSVITTVTEPTGRTAANVLVDDVQIIGIAPISGSAGGLLPGSATFVVLAQWTLTRIDPNS